MNLETLATDIQAAARLETTRRAVLSEILEVGRGLGRWAAPKFDEFLECHRFEDPEPQDALLLLHEDGVVPDLGFKFRVTHEGVVAREARKMFLSLSLDSYSPETGATVFREAIHAALAHPDFVDRAGEFRYRATTACG